MKKLCQMPLISFKSRNIPLICLVFLGAPAKRVEDACHANYFDLDKTPYITLVSKYISVVGGKKSPENILPFISRTVYVYT